MAELEPNGYRRTSGNGSLNEPPKPDGSPKKKNSAGSELYRSLVSAEEALDGDVVVYNGPINENGYGRLIQATKNVLPDRTLILALATYGGSADSAYRIARYAQNYFRDFIAFIPTECKSAGTLLALGASKIFMSPFGELGPLDVQVLKANEIFERRSGLLSKSAVWSLTEEHFRAFEKVLLDIKLRSGGAIGFKAASNAAALLANGLISPIAAQLDPLSIGEDYQNLHIAQEYGVRLIEKFSVIEPSAVTQLVEAYPSHGFVIDLFEAQQLLGNVEMASKELIQLHACLPRSWNTPDANEVSVLRLRDIVSEEDDENDEGPKEPPAANSRGVEGDKPSGTNQGLKRRDRRNDPP